MTQRDEVWAQGAKPGDAPISSRDVPVDPVIAARKAARDNIRAFAKGPRPNGASSVLQRLHDLAVALALDD